jgi:hypothetical protein
METNSETHSGAAVSSSDMVRPWISVKDALPPQGEIVQTKLDDTKHGVRNIQELRLLHRLWFLPDGSMYVYYEPTHWRSR